MSTSLKQREIRTMIPNIRPSQADHKINSKHVFAPTDGGCECNHRHPQELSSTTELSASAVVHIQTHPNLQTFRSRINLSCSRTDWIRSKRR